MVLNFFTNFCEMWWLAWLLPFLLGLLLGWLLWARYKGMVRDLEDEVARLKAIIKELEDALAKCKSGRADLEGQIATLKGRMREMEANAKAATSAPAASVASSIAATPKPTPPPAPKASTSSGVSADKFAALKSDNLQVVEGIGPKMESVLKDNGVHSWSALAAKSPDDLKGILGKYGDKYRIIDPTTWASQAKLAASGDWDDLITMQKSLDGGRSDRPGGSTDSKVEKIMIKLGILKRWKENDLKAVEGIGPKIAQLLNNDGITTWRALSQTSVERIQGILNAAGKRYQLADPTTWPKQAGMAADGKWDELQAYQDQLNGGK